MSRSITSVVRGRALNSNTQNQGRVATYVAPVSHTRYPGPGSVARVTMLSGAELGQAASTVSVGTTNTVVASYSYTPALSNSKIIVDYTSQYAVGGSAGSMTDAFLSQIRVQDSIISESAQQWIYSDPVAPGTGTRSGVLFPLMGAYNNVNNGGNIDNSTMLQSITPVVISVRVQRTGGDDTVTVASSATRTWLRITEVVA